jgi:NADH-quinone oxidoreductase subunit I
MPLATTHTIVPVVVDDAKCIADKGCTVCVDVCPFDALFWSPEFEYAEFDIRTMTHEKDRLGEWMRTVPPPPALDPGAPDAKELQGVRKKAAAAAPSGEPDADL